MRTLSNLFLTLVLLAFINSEGQTVSDGLKAWENQNYNTSRDIFKKISDAEPGNAIAFFYYGQALFKTGDITGATAAFDKGVLVQPGEFLNYIGQVKCFLEIANVAEAEKKIKLVLNASKGKDQNVLRFIADAYATNKNKDYVKAIDYAQKAIATSKGSADYNCYNTLADIYFEKHYSGNGDDKDAGNAVTNYEKSYQLNPKSAYAITQVGEIWSSTRNDQSYKLAMDALEKARAADPDFVPLHDVLAYLYQKTGQFEKAKTEQEIYMLGCEDKIKPNDRMINILYKLKDWNGAVELALKMNKINPGNCDYIRVLAHSYTELGKESEALNFFNQYQNKCDKTKMDIEDFIYLGRANKLAGNDSIAIRYYYQVIGMDSTKEQIMLKEIANSYYAARKYNEAADIYKILVEKYPTPNSLYRLVDSYYSAKRYKECKVAADTFIAQNPTSPLGYLYSARSLYFTDTLNDRKASSDMYKLFLEKAADSANKKSVLNSELIEAHKQLCKYQISKNNLKAAVEECDLALLVEPNNESVLALKKRIEAAIKGRDAPMKPKTTPVLTPVKPKGK